MVLVIWQLNRKKRSVNCGIVKLFIWEVTNFRIVNLADVLKAYHNLYIINTQSEEYRNTMGFLRTVLRAQRTLGIIHRNLSQIAIPISVTPPRSMLVHARLNTNCPVHRPGNIMTSFLFLRLMNLKVTIISQLLTIAMPGMWRQLEIILNSPITCLHPSRETWGRTDIRGFI